MIFLLAAALLTATPETLAGRIEAARAGDTIKLAPGDYGTPMLKGNSWSPALLIDASAANFTGLRLTQVSGLHIKGGSFRRDDPEKLFTPVVAISGSQDIGFAGSSFAGPGAMGMGINFRESQNVSVEKAHFSGLHRGILFNEVQRGRVSQTMFEHMRSDGIDIASSQKILIDAITCQDFTPVPPDHPDCVQMWSRPGKITQDVTIRNSTALGEMQGFSGFNHVRNGIDDGGFDRITITGNTARVAYPNAIALSAARDSVVRNNTVVSLPGSKYKASINVRGATNTDVRDNDVQRPMR